MSVRRVAGGIVLLIAALIGPASPVAAATTGIDVQLPLGHQIRGTITDPDGAAVDGAFVDIAATDDSTFFSIRSDASGHYVAHGVPDGEYRVQAAVEDDRFPLTYYGVPDATTEFDQATPVTVSGADAAGIDIRFAAASPGGSLSISGTFVDSDGQPVAGIEVLAQGDEDHGNGVSATDGTWSIDGLLPGDYRLFAQPPNGSPFLYGWVVDDHVGDQDEDGTPFTVSDTDLSGLTITISRGRTITGHVTLARAATVEVIAEGPVSGGAAVDASGNFEIRGLVPGLYTLLIREVVPGPEQTETGTFPFGYVGSGNHVVPRDSATTFDTTDGDVAIGTVAVPRGTDLVGKVTDGKVGLANSYLFVCDAAGEIGCAAATGAADGSFRIQHVPTGDFTIFVSVPGRVIGWYQPKGFTVEQFAAGTVHVVSGGPDVTGVKIVVPPGASISGRITGPGGVPIAGARVLGVPSGIPPNFVQPVSGADGRYIVTGLPTNQYALSVRPPEGSDYIGGYYQADGPGHFTASFGDATMFRVIEDRDKDAPVIGFRDPAPNATGIDPREASLQIRFSEPVDNATPSTIQLRDPRGRVVPITIDVEPEFRGVTIHPVDELLAGTKYRLTLTNGIVDWSGNHFAGASWSFTTSP